MSKVKKEPGYPGLILIYDLILIFRILHIASLDKLFNKKYRFYFLYVPASFILYYSFFFPFMHVQVVGEEVQDWLNTFMLTFPSTYILWFTISALSTIYFMVEPKLTRYAENMFKECELYVNKKTTARKIVIKLRNLVDGYYVPLGIAAIVAGIGLFVYYQTMTYSFKTIVGVIVGVFYNFIALQLICAGICWMIRRKYGNEEHRKKTKQEKKQEEKQDHFYDEWEKKCYENRFYGNFGTDDNKYYSFWKETGEDSHSENQSGRHINIASGYFKGCTTIDEIKGKYRTLAKRLHPDAGGNNEDFSRLNREYDAAVKVWEME